jgi:hypothetical protein
MQGSTSLPCTATSTNRRILTDALPAAAPRNTATGMTDTQILSPFIPFVLWEISGPRGLPRDPPDLRLRPKIYAQPGARSLGDKRCRLDHGLHEVPQRPAPTFGHGSRDARGVARRPRQAHCPGLA